MVWWAPLAITGGMKLADSLGIFGGGGEQPQQAPLERMSSLVPIQHEVKQDPGLIPIDQTPAPQPAPAQSQGQFFGDLGSPFGDPYAMGGPSQAQPGGYSPNERAMWVNAGGQVGGLLGNLVSNIF